MSESEVLERQKRRGLRGSILRTARAVYGQGGNVTAENCHHVAGRHNWKLAQVQEEIRFLVDKGYLADASTKRDALDREPPAVYRLTARGLEVLNGDVEETSIEL